MNTILYMHLVWFFESYLISIFIIKVFRNEFNNGDLDSKIILLGSFAALISFFLILNPSINNIVRSSVIIDSLDNKDGKEFLFRGFSIAENSSFSYGLIQGFICALCFIKIPKNWKYVFPILFLFISIIFNARIGLVPVLISILYLIFSGKLNFKFILFVCTILVFSSWFLFESEFSKNNEESLEWGFSVFTDTISFLEGEDNKSNYTVLTENMLFFPDDLYSFVFGEGKELFSGVKIRSDIGYVIQIFRGGLVYLLILILFLYHVTHKLYFYSSNYFYFIIFFATFFIANFKGELLMVPNGLIRLLILYYVFYLIKFKSLVN